MLQVDSNKEWKDENIEPLQHESEYKEDINFKRGRIYLWSFSEFYDLTGQCIH